jgi:hypothetical protein
MFSESIVTKTKHYPEGIEKLFFLKLKGLIKDSVMIVA